MVQLIKNNHNYTVQIIHFFGKNIQIIYGISLYFLNHTFLKYVIVSHYFIYII